MPQSITRPLQLACAMSSSSHVFEVFYGCGGYFGISASLSRNFEDPWPLVV